MTNSMGTSYLIVGASGGVGKQVLEHLSFITDQPVYRASHHKEKVQPNERWLDFEQPGSFVAALQSIDVVFLLRPPHLADVKRFFKPFIAVCQQLRVKHIVFLSVQGAETISFIPHAKIEQMIRKSCIDYTFIRTSYFMQNLTTALKDDIAQNDRIVLPAGNAPFLWVDVADVGQAIAVVLANWPNHKNLAYTITGRELLTFEQVSNLLSVSLGRSIRYVSPNLLRYIWIKRKEGMGWSLILVMVFLHMLPRFQKAPAISDDYMHITGLPPSGLAAFIKRHNPEWLRK